MPVTPKASAESLKTHIVQYQLVDLAAGAGLDTAPLFVAPYDIELSDIQIIGLGAAAGIDAGNTSVWSLRRTLGATSTVIQSYTFNNVNPFPAAKTPFSIGVPADATARIPAGTLLTLNIVNGTTANLPACLVQISYWINEDV